MRIQALLLTLFCCTLLVQPAVVLGCDAAEMDDCSMTACPMMEPPAPAGCHEPEQSLDRASSHCDLSETLTIVGCSTYVDPEPAHFEAPLTIGLEMASKDVHRQLAELKPPLKVCDSMASIVASRKHDRGRFTLLSSFLL